MAKRRIFIVSSANDVGKPLNKEEHLRYCEELEESVLLLYPDYQVDCEPGDVKTTTVSTYNFREREVDNIVSTCRYCAQQVWEDGNFWD